MTTPIHDDLVLESLDWEHVPACEYETPPCSEQATHFAWMRCCGQSGYFCGDCLERQSQSLLALNYVWITCKHCGFKFDNHPTYGDMIAATPINK